MNLRLIREPSVLGATLGSLYLNGVWECWTLEDEIRDVKVKGHTAIPADRYTVIIDQSMRFKRLLPRLLHVPDFEGVRIHPGNTSVDTEGCILPGAVRGIARVLQSKVAFEKLFARLKRAAAHEPLWITIENPEGASVRAEAPPLEPL